MEFIYIIFGIVVILGIVIGIIFNSFISSKAQLDEGWSGIDVQLKRRYDLIPQLVEIVKAYVKNEGDILTNVARLRSESMSENNLEKKASLEDQISQDVRKISVSVEAYPQLKSADNFLNLMNQLFEIEDQIQLSRRYYNGTVRNYNIKIKTFPNNLIAGLFSFKEADFFEASSEAKNDVKVSL